MARTTLMNDKHLLLWGILIFSLFGCAKDEGQQDSQYSPAPEQTKAPIVQSAPEQTKAPIVQSGPEQTLAPIAQSPFCEVCKDKKLASYKSYLSEKGYTVFEDSCGVFEIRNDQFRAAYGDQPVERCIFNYTDPEHQCRYFLSFFKCGGSRSPKDYYNKEYSLEREEWVKAPYAIFANEEYMILVYAALEHHRPLLEKHSQELQARFNLHNLKGNSSPAY